MIHTLNRLIAAILIVCTAALGIPMPAQAGIVATADVAASAERDRVKSFLDRQDVRAQLQAMGIDAAAAQERVAALTDEEARELAARIDTLPAGGDGVGSVVGALVLVFIILLITDLLGWTKVFPFTRTIR